MTGPYSAASLGAPSPTLPGKGGRAGWALFSDLPLSLISMDQEPEIAAAAKPLPQPEGPQNDEARKLWWNSARALNFVMPGLVPGS